MQHSLFNCEAETGKDDNRNRREDIGLKRLRVSYSGRVSSAREKIGRINK